MKQLEAALRAAGYRPTPEVKAERDRAIGALVKARKQKRRGAKQLKARVLALVSALKIPAPVATLGVLALIMLGMPGMALAHTGHDGGLHHMNAGGAVVLVGLTLGLAAHAWANWGPRRRLVAAVEGGPSEPAGGSDPEPWDGSRLSPGPEALITPFAPYHTIRIPYVAPERATEWHPTEPDGPFGTLTRGAFRTVESARAWADEKLGGNPYSIALVTWDPATESDTLTTVYTTEGK